MSPLMCAHLRGHVFSFVWCNRALLSSQHFDDRRDARRALLFEHCSLDAEFYASEVVSLAWPFQN